jgi:hypothetical protein
MTPLALYCHGYSIGEQDQKLQLRREMLKQITGQMTIPLFVGASTPTELQNNLRNIKAKNQNGELLPPVVLFLHYTPFGQLAGGLPELLRYASGELTRLFIVLISGEPILFTGDVKDTIDLANKKGLGGFTYWQYNFEASQPLLVSSWRRILTQFNDKKWPKFEQFHQVFNPVESEPTGLASRITSQLIGISAIQLAAHRMSSQQLNKWVENTIAAEALTNEERQDLAKWINHLAVLERMRTRLRHHDLGNRMQQVLTRVRRKLQGEVDDPDAELDLNTMLQSKDELFKDLNNLVSGYKEVYAFSCKIFSEKSLASMFVEQDCFFPLPAAAPNEIAESVQAFGASLANIFDMRDGKRLERLTVIDSSIKSCSVVINALSQKLDLTS